MKQAFLSFFILILPITSYSQNFHSQKNPGKFELNRIAEIREYTEKRSGERELSEIDYLDTKGLIYKSKSVIDISDSVKRTDTLIYYYTYDSLKRTTSIVITSTKINSSQEITWIDDNSYISKGTSDGEEIITRAKDVVKKTKQKHVFKQYRNDKLLYKKVYRKRSYGWHFRGRTPIAKFKGKEYIDANNNVIKTEQYEVYKRHREKSHSVIESVYDEKGFLMKRIRKHDGHTYITHREYIKR
jgi:hypothetical protein